MRTGRMTMGGGGGGFSQKSISWKGRAKWLFLSSFAVGAWAQVGGDDYDYDYEYEYDDLRYQSGVIPFFENTTRIRVCSSPWTPAVACEVGSTDSPAEQWRQASGYEIEVFKKIMPMLGWTDEMLDFRCMDWAPMMEALEDGSGACDIAPSGIGPDTETMELGVQYSDPSIFAGFAVMMRPQETSSRNIWYFFSAMSWEVWVALILSAFVAGSVVWLMELGSQTITSDTRYLSSVVWDTVGRPVQMRDLRYVFARSPAYDRCRSADLFANGCRMGSIAGNLVAWVWSFTAFIVMSLYNASLTVCQPVAESSNLLGSHSLTYLLTHLLTYSLTHSEGCQVAHALRQRLQLLYSHVRLAGGWASEQVSK